MIAVLVLTSALLNAGSLAPNARGCTTLPSAHLRVRLTISSGPVESMRLGIRHIVDSVWQPEGLTFDWVEGVADNPWEGIDVWIAAVDGFRTARGSPLGDVRFGNGAPRPLVRVYMAAVIAWVERYESGVFGMSLRGIPLSFGDAGDLVEKTLGYAAAHEMGHYVLASKNHSRTGVMQAGYGNPRELGGGGAWQLDPASRVRLKDRLAQTAICH